MKIPIYFSLFPQRHTECVRYTQQYYWTELAWCCIFCWLSTWFLFPILLKQLSSGVKTAEKQRRIEIQRGLIFTLNYAKSKSKYKNLTKLFEAQAIKKKIPHCFCSQEPRPVPVRIPESWNTVCFSPVICTRPLCLLWCRYPVPFFFFSFCFVCSTLSNAGQSYFLSTGTRKEFLRVLRRGSGKSQHRYAFRNGVPALAHLLCKIQRHGNP